MTGATAFCFLFLPAIALAESCPIQSLAEREAPVRVEIKVLALGKPLDYARVEFFEYKMMRPDRWSPAEEKTPRVTLFANARGVVHSPRLPTGEFHVIASRGKSHSADPVVTQNDLVAHLYLSVDSEAPENKGAFTMQLMPSCNMPPPVPLHWSAADEQMPIKYRIQAFSGTVYDPSGAVVAGAAIKVIRKGTQGKDEVAEVNSDPQGHFAVLLPEGTYIGVFSSGDFGAIVPFEVIKDGSADFKVTLGFMVTVAS